MSKAEEIGKTSSLQKGLLKETERSSRSTEDDLSFELSDSPPTSRNSASESVRASASSRRMHGLVLDPPASSPNSEDGPQGIAKKQIRTLPAATEWAEVLQPRAPYTSFGRLTSQTLFKTERKSPYTKPNTVKVKVQLHSEQVQDIIGKLSLSEQSQQMRQVAVSKMTGSLGKKLGIIEKSRDVINVTFVAGSRRFI